MVPVGKQVRRWYGGARIVRAAILRETTHHAKAVCPLGGLRGGRLHRPCQLRARS